MAQPTKVNGSKEKCTVKAFSPQQTKDNIKVVIKKVNSMAWAFTHGLMVENFKGIIKIIRNMASVFINGPKVNDMKAFGAKDNKKVLVATSQIKRRYV